MKARDSARSDLKKVSPQTHPKFVILHYYNTFKSAVAKVRCSLRSDSKSRIDQICSDATKAADKGHWKSFYKIRNQLCPSKSSSLASIDFGGSHHSTFSDIVNAFVLYFS